ncbi:DEAD/DEAH box helicase [soil metagenome]
MLFQDLGLSPEALQGVTDLGFTEPTPIQAQSIPLILQKRDVIGASQTGTGKTAAFMLPTYTLLGAPGKLRCLILEPTRELAAQVISASEELGRHTGLRHLLIHGGVGYGHQKDSLEAGVDIVTATPGRLLDLMSQRAIDLSDIEILVLDEVDRMLDMGFLPDVRKIIDKCPRDRQTLFFSATMPPQIQSLANWALRDPAEIEIGQRRSAADTVSHYFYPCAFDQRHELLMALLKITDFKSVMIFTRTKAQADRLFRDLQKNTDYDVTVMHSDIRQSDRAKALEGFRTGKFDVIIATDLAARGLDISGVSHVINYSVPENAEDYVHRIGRTGRAKAEGDAFTILTAEELPYAESVERLLGQKIERRKLEDFPYNYTTILDIDAPSPEKLARMVGRRPKTRSRRRR